MRILLTCEYHALIYKHIDDIVMDGYDSFEGMENIINLDGKGFSHCLYKIFEDNETDIFSIVEWQKLNVVISILSLAITNTCLQSH